MREIFNNFQTDIEDSINLAVSLLATENFAVNQIKKMSDSITQGGKVQQFAITSKKSDNHSFFPRFLQSLTFDQIIQYNFDHKGVREELVHAKIIQRWYKFLEDLFQNILNSHFSGQKLYAENRGSNLIINTSINLSVDTKENLIQNIQERAFNNFCFLKAEDKLARVEKFLDKKVDETIKKNIKKHIAVRNTWQHNNGIVRSIDLSLLGLQNSGITMINSDEEECLVKQEETLVITIYELLKVKDDFYRAGYSLVADSE